MASSEERAGLGGIVASHASGASPYDVISYPSIVALAGASALLAIVLMSLSAVRYWRHISFRHTGRPSAGAIWRATIDAAAFHNMRAGGGECTYPTDRASPARRRLHALVAYGFSACLASTIAAGVLQDWLGSNPPYPWFSAPVLLGVVGGAMIAVGTTGLLALKHEYAHTASQVNQGSVGDVGLLLALLTLAVSGLATLALRSTSAFGPLFLTHLIAVITCFTLAPFTSFPHFLYRVLSILEDHLERTRERAA